MLDLTRFPAAVTRAMTALSLVAAVIAVVVHLATFGPESWSAQISAVWPLLFFAIFPIAGSAIAVMSFAQVPIDRLIGDLPLAIKIGLGVLTVYVVVNFALFFRATAGAAQPPMLVARGFTGHAIYFLTAAAVIWYQLDRVRGGKIDLKSGLRDEALERDPLPAPLSRLVVLQTRLSPAECATRLSQAPRPLFFALIGRYGLRGEANPVSFRLQLGGPQSSLVYAFGRFEGTSPTFIRVLLTFKRWYLIVFGGTVLLLPVIWLMLSPVQFAWQGILFVLLFGIGGNLVYGRAQMRSLLRQIENATEAQPVSIG